MPPPNPRLMNRKVRRSICSKKLTHPKREDTEAIKRPSFTPFDLWFAIDSKYKNRLHNPRNNPHPNMFTDVENEVGLACKK